MHHDAKKMIAVEIRGRSQSLCQVRNRLAQTGGGGGLYGPPPFCMKSDMFIRNNLFW